MKYSEKLLEKMVWYIEQDLYTVTEICKMTGIARKTYYEWRDTKPEFREEINKAMERRDEMLVATARMSLKQRLEGYTLTEEKITYEPAKSNQSIQIEKSRVIRKKQYPPDLGAIKYVLDRNEKRNEAENKPGRRPLIINVPDQKTADGILAMRSPGYWEQRQKMIDEKYATGVWSRNSEEEPIDS